MILFMAKQTIEGTQPLAKTSQFLQARGIAKEVFQALGGGEAFLKADRLHFYGEQPNNLTVRRDAADPIQG